MTVGAVRGRKGVVQPSQSYNATAVQTTRQEGGGGLPRSHARDGREPVATGGRAPSVSNRLGSDLN